MKPTLGNNSPRCHSTLATTLLGKGIVDISGSHEELVFGATQFLSVLRPGDEYLAVSVPDFWNPDNMGIRGRYLSMNRLVAQRGISVRRVFLITLEEAENPQVRSILWAHHEARRDVDNMEIKVKVVPIREEIDSAIESGRHSGWWIHGDQTVRLTPVYDEYRRITTLRFRLGKDSVRIARREFGRDFNYAEDLQNWLLARGDEP